jgi:hypothetical protein
MAHKLAVIAATGIAGLAVCLGAAAAINGGNLGNGFDGIEGMFGDKPRCEAVAGATATSRDLDWDGSDHAGLAVQGTATYTPGTNSKVHVTGDPQVIAHLRVEDGAIEMDCRGWRSRQQDVAITLPGREFRRFEIAGGGKIILNKLKQDDLKIEIAGAGSVHADGKVDTFKIEIGGSGDADFGDVAAREARVEIGGSGTADIAPSELARVEIAGSGDANLHSNPRHLETEIAGSGRIHRLAGGS